MNKTFDFIRTIEKLKTIERFNKTSNLSRAESDAEHIWHLVMMVYLFTETREDINRWKAVEIALVHDLVEVYAGDVNLWDEKKKSTEAKRTAEEKSAKKLFNLLPSELGRRFYSLWEEYEARETREAKFVYALDKIQPFIQRIVARDNGWKEKQVNETRLAEIKPQLVKDDVELSRLWDDLTEEAKEKGLLWE